MQHLIPKLVFVQLVQLDTISIGISSKTSNNQLHLLKQHIIIIYLDFVQLVHQIQQVVYHVINRKIINIIKKLFFSGYCL